MTLMLQAPRNHRIRPSAHFSTFKLLQASKILAGPHAKLGPVVQIGSWGLVAVFPWLMGQAISAAFPPAGTAQGNYGVWVALMVGMAIIMFPTLGFRQTTLMHTRYSTSLWLRAAISQKVVDAGATGHDQLPPGQVVTGASADAESMGDVSMMSVQMWGWFTALVVSIVMISTASWKIALVLVLGVLLSSAVAMPVSKVFRKRMARQRKDLARLTDHTTDGVSGLRVLRGVGGQQQFLEEYHTLSRKARDSCVSTGEALAGVVALASLTPGVLTLVLVLWAVLDVRSGAMQSGDIAMIAGATRFLYMPISQLSMMPSNIGKGHVARSRINKILAVEVPEDAADVRAEAIPDAPLHDPVTGVTTQPGQLTVISAVDTFQATSVAHRLARLNTSTECGTVGGVSLAEWPLARVRETIVLNDTHPLLLSGTLRNQLDPWQQYDDDTLRAALHVAAADDVLSLLPDGLADYVAERGRSLSGGQRQRVALARVLVRDPQVLILVEPTSAVDAFTESLVAQRMANFRKGKTTIVVSASPMLREVADVAMTVEGAQV